MIDNYFKVQLMCAPNFKNKSGQNKGVFPNAKNPHKHL